MHESKIEIDASGGAYLVCWYDAELRNWDEVIKLAIAKHKVDDNFPILCLPAESEVS